MPSSPSPAAPIDSPPARPAPLGRSGFLACILIVMAAIASYVNSIGTPFLFDDLTAVVANPSLEDITNLREVLWPSHDDNGSGAFGRPMVNLSFALNYAVDGLEPRGYHVFNIAVHACAGLLLFGLVRRLLGRIPAFAKQSPSEKATLAGLAALVWVVHPLQTESVTCIVQRTESLMGMFFLGVFYAFARSMESERPARWRWLVVLATLAGMATKEVMVVVPVLLLLFDRTFYAGTFLGAWRERWRLHLSVASTWMLLAVLVARGGGQRGSGAGFGLGVTVWDYLLTQCKALVIYLRLSIWPHPLVLDYGARTVESPADVWWQGLVILGLLGLTAWAVVRRPMAGFLGAWFFIILAPSSSILPLVGQTVAEHRMYLSLAAIVVGIVLTVSRFVPRWALMGGGAVVTLAFGTLTIARNFDFETEISIWEDTCEKVPTNARAVASLARVHYMKDDFDAAVTYGLRARAIEPRAFETNFNLALSYLALKKMPEAVTYFQEAVNLVPDEPRARLRLGIALLQTKRFGDAVENLEVAVDKFPDLAEGWNNLGLAWIELGDPAKGITFLEKALKLRPDYGAAHGNFGVALFRMGRTAEALSRYERALELDGNLADVHFNYAIALAAAGRASDAAQHYREALRLEPEHLDACLNLGVCLAQQGEIADAIVYLTKAVSLAPDRPEAHANLGMALNENGQPQEAVVQLKKAVELRPDYAVAHYGLGNAYLRLGRYDDAKASFGDALRADPQFSPAAEMLRRMERLP